MSHFLDRLKFFTQKHEAFANGHGVLTVEDRKWEDAYRSRWQHYTEERCLQNVAQIASDTMRCLRQ